MTYFARASLAVLAGVVLMGRQAQCAVSTDPPSATPPGITLQEFQGGSARRSSAGKAAAEKPAADKAVNATELKAIPFLAGGGPNRNARNIAYGDMSGRTLYTYDNDTKVGVSACYDACAQDWAPALVPAGAKPFGEWSIISRTDKSKQWAFKNKPLYAHAKESGGDDKQGEALSDTAWHIANFEPKTGVSLPYSIGIGESEFANGQVLIDGRGMTIYAFSGKAAGKKADKAACATSTCADRWIPVAAGVLANPVGEFSLVSRDDGTIQWAYKNKPLFTFGGDARPRDANGMGVDRNFEVAYIARYFMPRQAGIRNDAARGPILATAEGMTLYRRDTSFHQPDGHGLPGSTPGSPVVGRAMGTKACQDECLKLWHPLVPASNAVPSGFWDIYVRADGTKQWAYKGFAMYTFAGDKKPGDKTGNDIYDILSTANPRENVYDQGVVVNRTAATFFWAYAEP